MLDFDGGEATELLRMFEHSWRSFGGTTSTVTTAATPGEESLLAEVRHLRHLIACIQETVPELQLTDTDFEVKA